MVEFNNKIISYFFVGVLVVLAVGYVMGSSGRIFTGFIVSNETNYTTTTTSTSTSSTTIIGDPFCSDSDGGINYYVQGTTTSSNGTSLTDYCTYLGLREHYCDTAKNVVGINYNCPNGCSSGACLVNTTTTTSTSTSSTTITGDTFVGNLYVSSKPTGASVYLDGVYKAKTNTTIKTLAPKNYNLKLTKSGYVDYIVSVWVYSGQTSYVNAILQRNVGSINVTSIPKPAGIYLDGVYKGTTNRILTNIATGNHNIKLNKTGYYDYTKNFTVYLNVTSQVNAVLVPKNQTNVTY
ncbi:MAG: PEGA domain-containing protein [Nanoarchaeota archaeon]